MSAENDILTVEEKARLETELAKAKTDLEGVVNELKTARGDKAGVEGERDALKVQITELEGKLKNGGTGPTVTEAVQQELAKKDKETAQQNAIAAETSFKSKYKEFHPDNDPGGVKFSAIADKLKRFNTDGLVKESDFMSVLEEAYTLINPTRKPEGKPVALYADSRANGGNGPKEADGDKLSYNESIVVQRLGWDAEKFLKMKQKRPDYVKSLMKNLE